MSILICSHANRQIYETRDLLQKDPELAFQNIACCELCGGRWIDGDPEPKIVLARLVSE